MQNHKNDLKKPYTKIQEKCSLQLLYDEKIHQKSSLHQLTKNKMRFGHVSCALKSVVLGKNGLGQFDIPCPSSCQVPKWWDTRVLGLVRLILKLLKKQETRNKTTFNKSMRGYFQLVRSPRIFLLPLNQSMRIKYCVVLWASLKKILK